ncbi:MAG: DUF1232 domain-containing protein, partial [Candidatus Aureabacteria bacterium]|nr:DUF1232 domain-containing protein [Candidatus Auribacterota bacterium]
MWNHVKNIARSFTAELRFYRDVLRDPRTPWLAKVFIGSAVAYALSPIDIIPDCIPIIGYLDDLVIVPVLAGIGMRMVPEEV